MNDPVHDQRYVNDLGDAFSALRHAVQAAEEGRYAVASMFATTAGQLAADGTALAVPHAIPQSSFAAACEQLASAFGDLARHRALVSVADKMAGSRTSG